MSALFFACYIGSILQAQTFKPNPADKSVTMLVVVLGILIIASVGYAFYKKQTPTWLKQFLMYAILIEIIASIYMFTTKGKYNGPGRNYENQEQTSDSSQLIRP